MKCLLGERISSCHRHRSPRVPPQTRRLWSTLPVVIRPRGHSVCSNWSSGRGAHGKQCGLLFYSARLRPHRNSKCAEPIMLRNGVAVTAEQKREEARRIREAALSFRGEVAQAMIELAELL